jgi:chitosanase
MRLAPVARTPARSITSHALSPTQKKRSEALTSLFENGTPTLQYGYAEALGDGRGVTAGRAGFTSGTNDLCEVVQKYVAKKPSSPLKQFLPRLEYLARLPDDSGERASTKGLEGLGKAWKEAARDPVFRAVQDQEVDQTYFRPSQKHADALGLQTPLARAQLADAIIQHGDGTAPDGLPALIQRANAKAGGTPRTGVDEGKWLKAFLEVRRADLAHSVDPATREEWAGSVDRVGVYEDLLKAGNLKLTGPIKVNHGDFVGTIP